MAKPSSAIKYLVLCALFFFSTAVMAQAATYYVATTGNDTVSCTTSTNISTPRRSILQGMNCMGAGDILYIRGGSYNQSIDSNSQVLPSGTSWANAPLIAAYPGETVTLPNINLTPVNEAQYVHFRGLRVGPAYYNIAVIGTWHHVKFENMTIINGEHGCVQLGPNTHDLWFTGGTIHDCGLGDPIASSSYPLYISGKDILIENMEVYNSNRYCVHTYNSIPPKPDRVTVRNNVFHHCALQSASSAAVLMSGGDGHQTYNNVLYSNSGRGIDVLSGTNGKIYNNTVYGGGQIGIYMQSAATNVEVRNNIVYLNSAAQILDQGTGTILSTNLTTDPRFVNAAALNFSIQANSPAIDAGVTLSQVTTDIRKIPRPQGFAYDIGAYEGGTGLDSSPPAPPLGLRIN